MHAQDFFGKLNSDIFEKLDSFPRDIAIAK
jgi:hypothetical protein